ncbi:PAS-like protein [Cordyceps javanica]|uniref:PAS-like protein n=1 Tax=Cordyceps javanica TaxID=43265 RepID=A0A545W6N0_9HYPO|nr:PAS-like protein [Cordyceps javanica]TQW09650.1 PAS-like protein [Cordyceps javanica]
MDQTAALDAVPPLSPVSSQSSSRSLEDAEARVSTPALLLQEPYPNKPLPDGDAELPALQVANGDPDGLDPIAEDDLDPGSFDLVMPADQESTATSSKYRLEQRSELLFSKHHLHAIFEDSAHLHRFTNFVYKYRPSSVVLLNYYLSALKALRAIDYSNSVLRQLYSLHDFDFTHTFPQAHDTANQELKEKADNAFEVLVREDLPAYITHVWIQTVSVSIRHRVMGTSSDASEGLAEVFCLTDPSRHDNPIVFMSEQFNRTTQYGVDYVIGRNCRFLQGPCTNPFSIKRIREKLEAGVEHYETFLNYRRDGSPFMNLVMLAPLYDSRGTIRYFIGAQVDVSGLAMSSYDLDALRGLVEENADLTAEEPVRASQKDEITQFAEILTPKELDAINTYGGSMHRLPLQTEIEPKPLEKSRQPAGPKSEKQDHEPSHYRRNTKERVIIQDSGSQENLPISEGGGPPHTSAPTAASLSLHHNGRLTGVYEHYVLVRPYPSLRILFASPSMRVPGILQSPLLDRIGGSLRVREQLVDALAAGQGVTAKVKWLNASKRKHNRPARKKSNINHPLEAHLDADDDIDTVEEPEPPGRPRWLHCTPLSGSNGKVGVWMIVIVDEEDWGSRRFGVVAPPVPAPVQQQQMLPPRPDTATSAPGTALSGMSFAIGESREADSPQAARTAVRPRRSSETLGYLRSEFSLPAPKDGGGTTQAIHNQHASSAQRTPRNFFNNGLPASKFFSSDALSRAAGGGSTSKTRPTSPSSPRSSISSLYRAFPRREPPFPPWPARSDSKATSRSHPESKPRVVSMIPEEGYGKYSSESRRREEDETSSLHSRGSAFTVRIGEE